MPTSAGLLMYQYHQQQLQIFLAHPGGPFYKNKDDGCWTIPKGLINENEDIQEAAKREFEEETGIIVSGNLYSLEAIKYKNGKVLYAWAFENKTIEIKFISSNTFELEWPPKSGLIQIFPEIDKAQFFDLNVAKEKIHEAQLLLIERLERYLLEKNPLAI